MADRKEKLYHIAVTMLGKIKTEKYMRMICQYIEYLLAREPGNMEGRQRDTHQIGGDADG